MRRPMKICTMSVRKRRNFGTFAVSFAVRCERFGGFDPETLTCNEIFHFFRHTSNCWLCKVPSCLIPLFQPANRLCFFLSSTVAHKSPVSGFHLLLLNLSDEKFKPTNRPTFAVLLVDSNFEMLTVKL